MVIWYIFPLFGMLHQEQSGNPDAERLRGNLLPCRRAFAALGPKNFGRGCQTPNFAHSHKKPLKCLQNHRRLINVVCLQVFCFTQNGFFKAHRKNVGFQTNPQVSLHFSTL
jgi:hypothetical protein